MPCALTVSLNSSPSERMWAVVPSIDFRNTSRFACCAAVRSADGSATRQRVQREHIRPGSGLGHGAGTARDN